MSIPSYCTSDDQPGPYGHVWRYQDDGIHITGTQPVSLASVAKCSLNRRRRLMNSSPMHYARALSTPPICNAIATFTTPMPPVRPMSSLLARMVSP